MNEPFDFTFSGFGAAGIGLVWGWWCSMRFSIAKRHLHNWLAALFFTAALVCLAGWMTHWSSGLILLLCASGSAFFHYLWLQYLRKHYT